MNRRYASRSNCEDLDLDMAETLRQSYGIWTPGVSYERASEVGSCNGCNFGREFKVFVLTLGSQQVRLCASCLDSINQQARRVRR